VNDKTVACNNKILPKEASIVELTYKFIEVPGITLGRKLIRQEEYV
jgi:hypothetical protein